MYLYTSIQQPVFNCIFRQPSAKLMTDAHYCCNLGETFILQMDLIHFLDHGIGTKLHPTRHVVHETVSIELMFLSLSIERGDGIVLAASFCFFKRRLRSFCCKSATISTRSWSFSSCSLRMSWTLFCLVTSSTACWN